MILKERNNFSNNKNVTRMSKYQGIFKEEPLFCGY